MDLLGQEIEKKQQPKGKKVVRMLLIISVILLILSLAGIYILKANETKSLGLSINGKDVKIMENTLIQEDDGQIYISIEQLADALKYDYLKGGYLEQEVDENKGYIDTTNQIIEYEANSDQIIKIVQNSETDEQYYKLGHKIIKRNNVLYIALDDLNVGCNVVYLFSEANYKISINTTEYLISQYQNEDSEEQKIKIDDSINNQRAMSYNMMVASNESGKVGVVDLSQNSLIGYKYSTMQFDEYSQNFIVSNDGKYEVITKSGKILIEPRYEEISIINYSPLLYKVKISNKYGILDETGKLVINIEYDKIGYTEKTNLIEPALIIKDLKNNELGIVVAKEEKYGIVSLKTGEILVNCDLAKIYTKMSNSKDKAYYVEFNETEIELNRYIDYLNTTTVVTN